MKALVTGGGGFLGKAIVLQLLDRGDEVCSYSRGDYPDLRRLGVQVIRGDIADDSSVSSAVKGCDIVFHVAGKPGVWGPYVEYYRPNVLGTKNILGACNRHGVTRLVYTSTPSVVHGGGDMEGVDESAPYPKTFKTHYQKTKTIAEKMVLNANGKHLATISLRPHLIWGPGDNHLVPRLIDRGRSGKLSRVGKKPHLVDCTYIDNAAKAHLLAADRLSPGAVIAGKAYFISQGEPIDVGDLIDLIIGTAGIPPMSRTVSPGLAYALGWTFEMLFILCRVKKEPPMTRFLAKQLSTAHWFDISAARRDLNYHPEISIKEGLERLKQLFDAIKQKKA